MSEAEGTEPRAPLLGITPGLREILDEGWLERPPLPMPLASPVSTREGDDDLWPGKPAISSSFAELAALVRVT
jgi:hypothetical protein